MLSIANKTERMCDKKRFKAYKEGVSWHVLPLVRGTHPISPFWCYPHCQTVAEHPHLIDNATGFLNSSFLGNIWCPDSTAHGGASWLVKTRWCNSVVMDVCQAMKMWYIPIVSNCQFYSIPTTAGFFVCFFCTIAQLALVGCWLLFVFSRCAATAREGSVVCVCAFHKGFGMGLFFVWPQWIRGNAKLSQDLQQGWMVRTVPILLVDRSRLSLGFHHTMDPGCTRYWSYLARYACDKE